MNQIHLGDLRKTNSIQALAKVGDFIECIIKFVVMLQSTGFEFSSFLFECSEFLFELLDTLLSMTIGL